MKLVSLISGGIDSPVATALALEKGTEIVAVHFENTPFNDGTAEKKAIELVKKLSEKFNRKIKLFLVPHGKIQAEIIKNCYRKLTCVLCRRMMFRVGEKIAEEENAEALLTGESLGQVASQTLANLRAVNGCCKLPIVRPLLGMDKNEIIKLAERFGTMEISIQPGMCCELVPEKPATSAKISMVLEEEKKLNLNELVDDAVKNKKVFSWS